MHKRSRVSALLAAGVLSMGIAGVALAATSLNAGQVGITLSEKEGGSEECANFPLEIGDGEVGLHFILTSTNDASGLLDAAFSNPVSSFSGLADTDSPSGNLHWYTVITGSGSTVLESASTDATGDNLNLSHSCFGAEVTSPPDTAPPTNPPSFTSSEEADTDAPTEPSTDAFGANGTSSPADGAWLLVVALGVLLASIVVLTPARAKSRR